MSDDHCAQAVSAYAGYLADVCPTPNIVTRLIIKAELSRLQVELGDDPANKGNRPDNGEPEK